MLWTLDTQVQVDLGHSFSQNATHSLGRLSEPNRRVREAQMSGYGGRTFAPDIQTLQIRTSSL